MFSDGNKISMMRVVTFICVVCAAMVAVLSIILNRDLSGTATLVSSLLIPAFGGKAFQSYAEKKHDSIAKDI